MTDTAAVKSRPLVAGTLIAAASAFALGVNDVVVPPLYRLGPDPQSVVAMRYVFFIVAMLPIIAATSGVRLPAGRLPHALGSGVLSSLGSLGLLAALSRMPVAVAVVIVYTFPIWTALFAGVIARRAPSPALLGCLLLAFAGIAMSIGIGEIAVDVVGVLLALGGAVAFAASIVWNGATLSDTDPLSGSFYMAIGGFSLSLAVTLGTGGLQLPTGADGWVLLLLSSVAFSFAFLGLLRGIQSIGATATAMIMNLEVVFASLLAFAIFGEAMTLRQIGGAVAILLAVVLAQWLGRREAVR